LKLVFDFGGIKNPASLRNFSGFFKRENLGPADQGSPDIREHAGSKKNRDRDFEIESSFAESFSDNIGGFSIRVIFIFCDGIN